MRWGFFVKHRWRLVCLVLTIVFLLDFFGFFIRLYEKSYESEFTYALDVDIPSILRSVRSGTIPNIEAINECKYTYVQENSNRCSGINGDGNITLLLVIKSAVEHNLLRNGIRHSWGQEDQMPKDTLRRIFVLGQSATDPQLQKTVNEEQRQFGDIVQVDFIDSYYNNTIKSMASLSWVFHHCQKSKFVLFVDDDFYISVKNLLQFARNPLDRPSQVVGKLDGSYDGRLYGGYVYNVRPLRRKFSKWYVSLQEYPYSWYPPFVMGGASLMSSSAVTDFYHTIKYTKSFRLDDVYLGIVAKRAGITAIHNPNFYNWKRRYDRNSFGQVIASHEYNDPKELREAWHEQKGMGNA